MLSHAPVMRAWTTRPCACEPAHMLRLLPLDRSGSALCNPTQRDPILGSSIFDQNPDKITPRTARTHTHRVSKRVIEGAEKNCTRTRVLQRLFQRQPFIQSHSHLI
ncbi:hypothetical protein NMG60_11024255 [Bertholletia excelsa]